MKQRLTAIDIRALVMTLKRKIRGLRVANIYDIANKIYLFKLAAKGNKEFLLIEAGIRMHTTNFVRNKNSIPSGFIMKLRKHLRTKRVEDIRQVGIDRVVDITLGQDDNAFHILIEFYASGNLILTDSKYNIISLLRTHRYDEDTRCAVGEKYPFTHAANLSLDSIIKDRQGLEEMLQAEDKKEEEKDSQTHKKGKKKKKRGQGGLNEVLFKMVPYMTPLMAEHCLHEVGLDASDDFEIEETEKVDKLIQAALLCKQMVHDLENMEMIPGYIIYDEVQEEPDQKQDLLADKKQDKKSKKDQAVDEQTPQREEIEKELQIKPLEDIKEEVKQQKEKLRRQMNKEEEGEGDDDGGLDPDEIFRGKRVKEFVCFQLQQMKEQLSLEFDWFDECVDLYFTQIDKQKEESKIQQKEAEIYKKMNRIKNDQLKRIEGLQKEQDASLVKAKLLQTRLSEVQAIIEILTALQQSGIPWKEIWRMIKEEKRAGNPLANIVHSLDFEKEIVILIFNLLEMQEDQDTEEFFTDETEESIFKIDLDLTLSAQANIQKYFEIKKKTQDKEVRTKDRANEAIKQAEDQARKALLKTRNEQKLKTTRKPYWFEKFDWFISSENYLIISGKNAQQNEEIVKTYLGKKDVYVHSEMAGAASCIIKNPSTEEISPLTLNETGTWAICHSKAWDAKIVTNAFWVWGDQVSKTPESGEYLVTGSFIIRGKKNYINPQRLELGCTLMFKLDDDSIANHINERRNRTVLGQTEVGADENEDGHAEEADQTQEPADDHQEETEEATEEVVQETTTQKMEENVEEDVPTVEETPQEETKEEITEEAKEEVEEETKETQEEGEGDEDAEGDVEETPEEKQLTTKAEKKKNKVFENKNKSQQKKQENKIDHQQLPRGKKTKLKKKLKKYADQDEEDKKLIMELIGAKDMEIKAKNKAKAENEQYYQKGDKEQSKEKQPKGKDKQKQQQKQKGNQQKPKPQEKKESKAPREAPQQKAETSQGQTEDEKKEIEDIMKEENIKLLNDKVDISVLDKLTGNPKPNDTLLYAVPMCAPYSVINTHKYKVKVLPGQLKRGKARKLIQDIFGSLAKGNEVESVLFRGVPEEQILEVLPKGCQVLAAGLNKLKQNKKKGKKANKKKEE